MDLYTSTNNGTPAQTTSGQSALQQIEQNDATDLSPDSEARANARTGERFPWVPDEFYVYRGSDNKLYVGVNSEALEALSLEAEQVALQPEFEFKKDSDEAALIQNIADAIKLHLENDRVIGEFWVNETVRFETQRAGYNAAFAAKQLRDAESLFGRTTQKGEDAADNETFQKLMANYERAGREAAIQVKALYAALDKVEIDWKDAATRVLSSQARKYWTPRVRQQAEHTPAKQTERSNDATRDLMRAARARLKGAA